MWSYMEKHHTLIRLLCISVSLCVALCIPIQAIAQSSPSTSLCRQTGIVFEFFNGVQTTRAQAGFVRDEFKRLHGTTTPTGDIIQYEVFYNYSNGFEDFVETFGQRLQEQEGLLVDRYELFFEALTGGSSWWDRITGSVDAAFGILNGFVDWYETSVFQQITSRFEEPPTAENFAEQIPRIDTHMLEGKRLLFVAHSQGNLFVNSVYDHVRSTYADESVKVVHIAPASPMLKGKHILADKDLVINVLLRIDGSVPPITDIIPGYRDRPHGINGKGDFLGHGILEIYINQALGISQRVKNYINEALTTLVAPRAEATSGFFTATLSWDGSGDVDLHTFEPGGAHVYYALPQGVSGKLDHDNTVGFGPGINVGPEHYYASCDENTLRGGTYQIAIANFARAEGRTATVQIASWRDGVLATRSVTLGDATRDTPSFYAFRVTLLKDSPTGRYLIFVEEE